MKPKLPRGSPRRIVLLVALLLALIGCDPERELYGRYWETGLDYRIVADRLMEGFAPTGEEAPVIGRSRIRGRRILIHLEGREHGFAVFPFASRGEYRSYARERAEQRQRWRADQGRSPPKSFRMMGDLLLEVDPEMPESARHRILSRFLQIVEATR